MCDFGRCDIFKKHCLLGLPDVFYKIPAFLSTVTDNLSKK